jgi:aspartyl-tRNA(Asn)/glutamyl-tRNA(Gln) amidotransferase subunit A
LGEGRWNGAWEERAGCHCRVEMLESGVPPLQLNTRALTHILSLSFLNVCFCHQVRTLVRNEMTSSLTGFDALLTPTAPSAAYKLGEKTSDPLAMYKGDLMTVNVNLAGLPAVVVPCGFAAVEGSAKKLPVGVQFIGRAFREAELLEIAHAYEQTAEL